MPEIKITQREYELDMWIDNEDDLFEENYYDEMDFGDE